MKELEDYTWFPSVLRNFQTEFIGYIASRFNVYEPFVKYLKSLSLPVQSMTDLCSGSGEPAIKIFNQSTIFHTLILSDKYPNPVQRGNDKFFYEKESEDVLKMKFKAGTCYTMFNSFHHFTDKDKLAIVEKIHMAGSAAFLVEILEPGIICFLKILATTIGNFLLTPFVKPFSFNRLFLTYIIPINIFTVMYDGIFSVLKSSSARQYQKLFINFGDSIKVLRIKNRLSPLTIIHIPAKQ